MTNTEIRRAAPTVRAMPTVAAPLSAAHKVNFNVFSYRGSCKHMIDTLSNSPILADTRHYDSNLLELLASTASTPETDTVP